LQDYCQKIWSLNCLSIKKETKEKLRDMIMPKKHRINFFYILFLLWSFIFVRYWIGEKFNVEQVPFSDFQTFLKEKKLSEVIVRDNSLQGFFKKKNNEPQKIVITNIVSTELAKEFEQHGVKYSQENKHTFFYDLLSWILPTLFFFLLWYYIGKKTFEKSGLGNSVLSIGKSKAKIYVETEIKTTFADVAGVDEAKEDLKEIVNFLKHPKEFEKLGAHLPKGILLIGPPGTGKTLLAKAVAGQAGVPFFSISGSEFVELFVGLGAARVRDLFNEARQKAPCIIFIDELDALGAARSLHPISGGHDEKEQTLNQLLSELDGFDTKSGVVLLAATNRPEILDPALLRAGRFDRQILVGIPDKTGREEILRVHIKNIKINKELKLDEIAALTPGFTGADLANLVNEAALTATRKSKADVNLEDFTEAMERIVAGLERKNRLLNLNEKKIVAFHEMGHALVAMSLPGSDKIQKISIIPRGIGALGYTIQRPIEDRYLMTKSELLNKMIILLAGRMSEEIIFKETSTGSADDLAKATELAKNIVKKYGMMENLGPVVYDSNHANFLGPNYFQSEPQVYSDETTKAIDHAIKALMEYSAESAKKILLSKISILKKGAELLLNKETLIESELKELMA
jgi:cell division protease FtsH